MPSFIANPNRDASDTIAGFVYQVDVTLLRWLNLQSDEVLELERGEDIDIIQKWLDGGDLRTLEQVKRRSSSVTLRSPDALAAIANFCEHKANNPGVRLRFRFLTTGRTGKEKKWRLAGTGIEAWEGLRQGRLNDPDRATVAHEIRVFLKDSPKPEKLSRSAWDSLQLLISNEDESEFIELIESFEWSTGARDDSTSQEKIRRALIESHYAADEAAAQAILERLFLHVFRKLSQPGAKSLTSVELSQQLQLPSLSGADRQLFTILAVVREQGERLDQLEERFSREQGLVAALGAQMAQLKDEQGKSLKIEYRDLIPSLDPPEIAKPSIPRKDFVDKAVTAFAGISWVHLVGEPGVGKTQLTGLRPSELIGLRWRNVHADSITIDERYCRGEWGAPKSKASNATIAVNAGVIDRIHRLKTLTLEIKAGNAVRRYPAVKSCGPDDLVFASVTKKDVPMRDNTILTRFIKPAARKLGMDWVNWQALRRSHATWLKLAGADVKDAQAQMRHSRATTTLEIYQQFIPESQRRVVNKLMDLTGTGLVN